METLRCVIAISALAVLAPRAGADVISITNAGFEGPVVTTFTAVAVDGWTITGSGAGVWNITDAPQNFWNVGAPEGKQIAFVGREFMPVNAATISQVLSDQLRANTTYTLTGLVGHPIGFGSTPNPDTVYSVALLAGGTVLASISGTGPEGTLAPFSLSFTSGGSPFVGQALEIRLSGTQAQTGFDNLQLNATANAVGTPEPASAFVLLAALAGVLTLRGAGCGGEKVGNRRGGRAKRPAASRHAVAHSA